MRNGWFSALSSAATFLFTLDLNETSSGLSFSVERENTPCLGVLQAVNTRVRANTLRLRRKKWIIGLKFRCKFRQKLLRKVVTKCQYEGDWGLGIRNWELGIGSYNLKSL